MELKEGYKQTEVGVIPVDWEVSAVRKKGAVVTGKALAANAPGLQRPYLRTKNVFDGRIDIEDVLAMPMTDEQFVQFQVQAGDVLLNEGQSLELVGRCAIYQDEYPEPCAMQNALLRFRARERTSNLFASYLFRHCQHTGVFAKIALQTTSVAHLGGSRLERLRLAWPPTKAEQEAIAEALSDTDALIESLEQLIAKKRQIKQGAMQELLTGKKRLHGFSGEWEVKTLGSMANLYQPETISGDEFTQSGHPVYGANGRIGFYSRFNHELPQITISCRGNCGTVNRTDPFSWITGNAMVVNLDHTHSVDHDFVFHQLREQDYSDITTGSGQPQIVRGPLREFQILMPANKDEQTAIATILSDMDAEIAALETKLAKARQVKQGMMQELLTGNIRLLQPQESHA